MPYDYGKSISAETLPYLDSYMNTAQAGYADDMNSLKRDAMRELDAEISGQDQQGRVAGYQRMALDQGLSDEKDRFVTGLGLQRAQLGETLRQRGEQRGWDVQDRNERLYQLRKKAEAERKIKEDEARGGLSGDIGTGVGSIVGGVAGGYFGEGNPYAIMAGAGAGGAVGGSIGSAV